MIKIGVIGAGGNTISAHLPKLIEQKDVEVIAVANRTILSGSKVAKKFNIKHVYNDWQEVIMNDEVDAICIGTWPNMHAAITIEALESGKHVLTEARMAMDSDEAELMFNVSKNYPDLITQIVPAPHTLPYDNTIKDWVSNEMGDLILFDVKSTTGEFIDYDREIHWREIFSLPLMAFMNSSSTLHFPICDFFGFNSFHFLEFLFNISIFNLDVL